MRKPTEKIELSYPGILDGQVYTVAQGLKYLKIPDPSYQVSILPNDDPNPSPEQVPVLEFTRRPYSNVFRLCH